MLALYWALVPVPLPRPMLAAWRSISPSSVVNSWFRVARLPEKVPEADWVAKLFNWSRMFEMLFRPPSMVCRILVPSLALRTPCVSSLTVLRSPFATARPAASSPEELIR